MTLPRPYNSKISKSGLRSAVFEKGEGRLTRNLDTQIKEIHVLFAGVGEGIYTVLESLARISTEISIYYVRSFKSANCPQVVSVGGDPPPPLSPLENKTG